MDFGNLVQARRSVRSFTNQEVSHEDIIQILRAAQAAPSGGNMQPWHFYVVRSQEVKQDFYDNCCQQNTMLTAPVLIAVVAEPERSGSKYGERGRTLYCIQDTAAAIQNILLCARELGLGTCWCGAFNEDEAIRILGLQKGMRPVALIPVGVPELEPAPRGRRELSELVTFIN